MNESRGTRLILLTAAALGLASPARSAPDAAAVAAEFAGRLAAAMEGPVVARDRLWIPGVRDSTRRLLDLRTQALFDWSDVRVEVESAWPDRGGPAEDGTEGAPRWIDVVLVVHGTATWKPLAWGVAESFWALQLDENAEANRIARREAWRLKPHEGRWLAAERARLCGAEVVGVELSAGVYLAQDAMLVEGSYYLRSLVDSLEVCRFLLDRRAVVYGFTVDGQRVPVARGGELGSLGLEGFSSESESSFRFPAPLAKGREVLVKFRVRSPLVHMRGPGFVTTFPIHSGPFRERVWYPTLLLDHLAASVRAGFGREGVFEVRFPKGTLVTIDSPADSARAVRAADPEAERMEEEVLRYRGVSHYRDFDFFLLEPGVDLDTVDWSAYEFSPFRLLGDGVPFLPSLGQAEDEPDGPASMLDPHPRSRRAIVEPLLTESTMSSRDIQSELQDLLPDDLLDIEELMDDSAADADRGAGEPDRD